MKVDSICKVCMSYMLVHPENEQYRKCPSCGYCKLIGVQKMSISKEELLKGRDVSYPSDYTQEVSDNLDELLIVLNKVRSAYGKPMTVNSGWRPPSINAATPGAAAHSLHCEGLACDFADPDGKLMDWVLENLELMKDCGVYLEHFNWTPNWVHMGIRAPKSGHRIFIPNANRPTSNRWDGNYDQKFD